MSCVPSSPLSLCLLPKPLFRFLLFITPLTSSSACHLSVDHQTALHTLVFLPTCCTAFSDGIFCRVVARLELEFVTIGGEEDPRRRRESVGWVGGCKVLWFGIAPDASASHRRERYQYDLEEAEMPNVSRLVRHLPSHHLYISFSNIPHPLFQRSRSPSRASSGPLCTRPVHLVIGCLMVSPGDIQTAPTLSSTPWPWRLPGGQNWTRIWQLGLHRGQ